MNRKFLLLIFLVFSLSGSALAKKASVKEILKSVYSEFDAGNYDEVISILGKFEKRIKKNSKKAKEMRGLIYYWKGMSYVKLNDFELAENNFIRSLALGYRTKDIYYEYGQVLYVANKYKRARIAFKKSMKAKYKVGVSLYYIAFISQELKDYKKAVAFYRMIEKLPEEDKKDVVQAARMQTGDIYLKQIERQQDAFRGVEKYVIPQYERALSYDEESALADTIRKKIRELQRKYELILFRMRNGKLTAQPPYYIRGNLGYGSNTNAAAATEAVAGSYSTAGIFSRYSFYPNSTFSVSPEFSANYQKYNESDDSVAALSNYSYTGSVILTYEHLYKKKAATFFVDLDYTYNASWDTDDDAFAASNNTTAITFSENITFWKNSPSTFRLRYTSVDAEEETSTSTANGFIWEQVVSIGGLTLFVYNDLTVTTFAESEANNTSTLTNRVDAIFPTFYNLFNPTLYVSNTATTYTDDSDRGTPNLVTYGLNMNRPVGKHLYLTVDYSMAAQKADGTDSDEYDAQVLTINLDLIY